MQDDWGKCVMGSGCIPEASRLSCHITTYIIYTRSFIYIYIHHSRKCLFLHRSDPFQLVLSNLH